MASPNTRRNASKTGSDLYNTPVPAIAAAWEAGIFDELESYWDPCDGLGCISDFLEEKGKTVFRSDIRSWRPGVKVHDFLTPPPLTLLLEPECIVMNPPFKLSEQFIDQALVLAENVIMFNRAAILETGSRTQKHMSGEWPLQKFWSFGNRQSCTEGPEQEKTSNSVWYGWFRYNRQYGGQPQIGWLFT